MVDSHHHPRSFSRPGGGEPCTAVHRRVSWKTLYIPRAVLLSIMYSRREQGERNRHPFQGASGSLDLSLALRVAAVVATLTPFNGHKAGVSAARAEICLNSDRLLGLGKVHFDLDLRGDVLR